MIGSHKIWFKKIEEDSKHWPLTPPAHVHTYNNIVTTPLEYMYFSSVERSCSIYCLRAPLLCWVFCVLGPFPTADSKLSTCSMYRKSSLVFWTDRQLILIRLTSALGCPRGRGRLRLCLLSRVSLPCPGIFVLHECSACFIYLFCDHDRFSDRA